MTGSIFLETTSLLDVALYRSVMAPAALALDVAKVCAGAISAGRHAPAQTVTGKIRYIVQSRHTCAISQDRVDAGGVDGMLA